MFTKQITNKNPNCSFYACYIMLLDIYLFFNIFSIFAFEKLAKSTDEHEKKSILHTLNFLYL